MIRAALASLLFVASLSSIGCRDVDGTIHIGSDPPEHTETWDGDVDRTRYEKQQRQREAAAQDTREAQDESN